MTTETPRDAYGVGEFCRAHNLSRAFFYKLMKQGRGPKSFKVGRRTLISSQSAAQWRSDREAESSKGGSNG